MSVSATKEQAQIIPRPEPGSPPELAWLPVERLRVDPEYQRTLKSQQSQKLVRWISQNFRWRSFQAILAVKKEDGWIILDGQHRTAAARLLKITHVPAVVVNADSVAEEATAFINANSKRLGITAVQIHRAKLCAGDPASQAIERLCAACNIKIAPQTNTEYLKPGETLALGVLHRISKMFDEGTTAAIVNTVADAYRSVPNGLRANFFHGVAEYVSAVKPEERARAIKDATAFFTATSLEECLSAIHIHQAEHGLNARLALRALIGAHANAPKLSPYKIVKANTPQAKPRDSLDEFLNRDGKGEVLPFAVNRRCKKCSSVFSTKIVAQYDCSKCEKVPA